MYAGVYQRPFLESIRRHTFFTDPPDAGGPRALSTSWDTRVRAKSYMNYFFCLVGNYGTNNRLDNRSCARGTQRIPTKNARLGHRHIRERSQIYMTHLSGSTSHEFEIVKFQRPTALILLLRDLLQ